jgi:hypothetical protein
MTKSRAQRFVEAGLPARVCAANAHEMMLNPGSNKHEAETIRNEFARLSTSGVTPDRVRDVRDRLNKICHKIESKFFYGRRISLNLTTTKHWIQHLIDTDKIQWDDEGEFAKLYQRMEEAILKEEGNLDRLWEHDAAGLELAANLQRWLEGNGYYTED